MIRLLLLFALLPVIASAQAWKTQIDELLKPLGHRNLVLVADAAYPVQTSSGVQVIATGAAHLDVLAHVMAFLRASPAVRPLIAVDEEFRFVPDDRAPGATRLYAEVMKLLEGQSHEPIRRELHATLLAEVNTLARDFSILVIKTNGTIPYSSVFLTLECGYWTADDEAALRQAMTVTARRERS